MSIDEETERILTTLTAAALRVVNAHNSGILAGKGDSVRIEALRTAVASAQDFLLAQRDNKQKEPRHETLTQSPQN